MNFQRGMTPFQSGSSPPSSATATSLLPLQSDENGREFFSPTATINGGQQRGANAKASKKKKRLQHFLGQIKQLVRQQQNGGDALPEEDQQKERLSTLDALGQALEMLRHSQSQPMLASAAKEEAAGSPSSSVASSPSAIAQHSANNENREPIEQSAIVPAEMLKPCGSPQSGASVEPAVQAQPMLGRRLLGHLLVALPEGVVLQCQDNPTNPEHQALSAIAPPGHSLLALLHGKGAQTLLLNAFCGHPRRRMYARIKWAPDQTVRACELLCEFSVDPQSMARRLANIQVFCVQSGTAFLTLPPNGQHQQQQQLTFTTRHNSGCALIYLDSASIPVLSHFPSEVTGKSLFTLVHPEDVHLIRAAHQQLHSSGGTRIVRTPGLRLLAYAGHAVPVDSEWAAFVNPWTRHIEMVVGKHTFLVGRETSEKHPQKIHEIASDDEQQLQDHALVHALLAKPVPETCRNEDNQKIMAPREEQQPMETVGAFDGQQQQVLLSYNQINCLENVHRLLKSQSQSRADTEELVAANQKGGESPPVTVETQGEQLAQGALTRAVLQQHDQRWEEECRDHWRRRLSANGNGAGNGRKRTLEKFDRIESTPAAKQIRRGSDGGHSLLFQQHQQNQKPSATPPFLMAASGHEMHQLLNCLHFSQNPTLHGQNKNQTGGAHNLLMEQLLQAATAARTTLAMRLMQQQEQHQFS